MASLLNDAISYGKIPVDDPDVEGIFDAAESYITNSIEEKDLAVNEADPVFCLAVKMLVSHWFDNRPAMDIPDGVHGLLTQLKYCRSRHHHHHDDGGES